MDHWAILSRGQWEWHMTCLRCRGIGYGWNMWKNIVCWSCGGDGLIASTWWWEKIHGN